MRTHLSIVALSFGLGLGVSVGTVIQQFSLSGLCPELNKRCCVEGRAGRQVIDPTDRVGASRTLWRRGHLRFEMRDFNGACSDYGLAASLDPDDAWQIVGDRANALIHLGEYRAAVEDLNSALYGCRQQRKNPYWIYGQRALAKSDLGDHVGALYDLNRAIELGLQTKGEFRPARYFASRAYEYQSLRDLHNALKDYDQAIALEPGNVWAYKQRALVKEALHNKEGAFKDYLESVMRGGGSAAIRMLETGISICGERLHVSAF